MEEKTVRQQRIDELKNKKDAKSQQLNLYLQNLEKYSGLVMTALKTAFKSDSEMLEYINEKEQDYKKDIDSEIDGLDDVNIDSSKNLKRATNTMFHRQRAMLGDKGVLDQKVDQYKAHDKSNPDNPIPLEEKKAYLDSLMSEAFQAQLEQTSADIQRIADISKNGIDPTGPEGQENARFAIAQDLEVAGIKTEGQVIAPELIRIAAGEEKTLDALTATKIVNLGGKQLQNQLDSEGIKVQSGHKTKTFEEFRPEVSKDNSLKAAREAYTKQTGMKKGVIKRYNVVSPEIVENYKSTLLSTAGTKSGKEAQPQYVMTQMQKDDARVEVGSKLMPVLVHVMITDPDAGAKLLQDAIEKGVQVRGKDPLVAMLESGVKINDNNILQELDSQGFKVTVDGEKYNSATAYISSKIATETEKSKDGKSKTNDVLRKYANDFNKEEKKSDRTEIKAPVASKADKDFLTDVTAGHEADIAGTEISEESEASEISEESQASEISEESEASAISEESEASEISEDIKEPEQKEPLELTAEEKANLEADKLKLETQKDNALEGVEQRKGDIKSSATKAAVAVAVTAAAILLAVATGGGVLIAAAVIAGGVAAGYGASAGYNKHKVNQSEKTAANLDSQVQNIDNTIKNAVEVGQTKGAEVASKLNEKEQSALQDAAKAVASEGAEVEADQLQDASKAPPASSVAKKGEIER